MRRIIACVQINRPRRGDGAQVADDCLLRVAAAQRRRRVRRRRSTSATGCCPIGTIPRKAAYFAREPQRRGCRRRGRSPFASMTTRSASRISKRGPRSVTSGRATELAARKALRVLRAVLRDSFRHRARRRAARARRRGRPAQLAGCLFHRRHACRSTIPILLKRVELRFDASAAEFSIHETDRPTELYSALFVDLQNTAAASLRNRTAELENAGFHPVGWRRHRELPESRRADAVAHERPAARRSGSPTSPPMRRECGAIRC